MSRNQIYLLVGGCLFVLCAISVLVAGIFFFASGSVERFVMPMPEVGSAVPRSYPNANGNSLGDPNAPIKIEEFSDFQCPYCQNFHDQTEALLVEQYVNTGKVYFTYRSMGNFLSQNIGGGKTESQDAALAAYCAGDQNKFWDMQAYLFANILG